MTALATILDLGFIDPKLRIFHFSEHQYHDNLFEEILFSYFGGEYIFGIIYGGLSFNQ